MPFVALVSRRVPLQRQHLLRHRLHHRIPYLTPADTPKIQYPKEVEVRVRNDAGTRCINQQKPKTKRKMKDATKYKAIYCMTCRTGCRISETIWSMKVVFQSHGETLRLKGQDTCSSSHGLPMEPRAKVELGSGKQSVHTHFPKDPNCDICLKTKITRSSCRRRAGTVVPRAEQFGDLITADPTIFLVKKVNRGTIIDMPW